MKNNVLSLMLVITFGLFSSNILADVLCDMPSGIDDGIKYWIKFKSESKMYVYEITDIDDCWIQIKKSDGSKYWYQVQEVAVIMAKPVE